MTNVDYKEMASRICSEAVHYIEKCENEDISITYIGEVFAVKIKKGIMMLDEKTFPHYGVDKLKKIFLSQDTTVINDESEDVGELPLSDKAGLFCAYILFGGIRAAIKNHLNPEYMLQNMGVKNAQEVISMVNNVQDIDNIDKFQLSIAEISDYLMSTIDSDQFMEFFLWGLTSFLGKGIINTCKENSTNEILSLFKVCKYISEKYYSIYSDRIIKMQYFYKEILCNQNTIESISEAVLDFIGDDINILQQFTCSCGIEDEIVDNLVLKHSSILLDCLFFIYYYSYENPQFIIKLGFTLMSEKFSAKIQEAIFLSFRTQDYAALIQYEYAWWCKETGGELSLPFPFSEETINLQDFNIVDYDLNNKTSLKIEQAIDDNILIEEHNHSTQILHDLEPYFVIFDKGASSERGSVYKRDYSSSVITWAEKQSKSLPIHGLAYILYKSRYFNWGDGCEFDEIFVRRITGIFNLQDKLTTLYPENKAKTKAWEILQKNKNLQGLLDSDKMKELEPVKKKS